jgi:ribonuclease T1
VCYYQTAIDNAVDEGYQLYQEGKTEGSGKYPHTYRNDEGFDFPVSGPYQEFPILNDFKDYNGGSPGADRVIFNEQGELAGVITHTGASGDDFVACVS